MRLPIMTLAVLRLVGPALAQEITDDWRAALEARLAECRATMNDGDMADLFVYTPPAVRVGLAEVPAMSEE